MGFAEAVGTCFRKYAVFSGRARRSEYWFFWLAYILTSFAVGILDALIMPAASSGPLSTIFILAVLLPSLAVGVRRLHDTDRTGWWLLLVFLPVIGAIILLVFAAQDGTTGSNRFGDDPKMRSVDPELTFG